MILTLGPKKAPQIFLSEGTLLWEALFAFGENQANSLNDKALEPSLRETVKNPYSGA